ncbi:MAG: RelA/SpoT family protein [Francisellaceae bacterium]
MVQVNNRYILTQDGLVDYSRWLELVEAFYPKARMQTIAGALDLLAQYGIDEPSLHGGNCFDYGVEMAAVLFDLQADEDALAAALLFELNELGKLDAENIIDACGEDVYKILAGTRMMSAIRLLQNPDPNHTQVDTFRKMLLSMVEDVRIVLVKLADRVCSMRLSKNWTESYRHVMAREILEIYAPLASRLGLAKTKWELEDRAFFCLYPVEYKKIARALNKRRIEREQYIELAIEVLRKALLAHGLKVNISGRVKHIYSIWRKLAKKNRDIDTLFDIRALRVLTDSIDDCYAVLGIVNDLWQPLTDEFADYIATPKPNGYRSIHTVVLGPENLTLEVQIRTHQMHEESEMGVAAHWRYKEGAKYDPGYDARVNWLRSLLDWESQLSKDMLLSQKDEINEGRVYVFTPGGDVVDLEKGSTVLDFAYHIHTMVGHRTKGAKISGRIVPLTTVLSTGDRVEILTHKEPKPSQDWANAGSGFIFSAKIRARVARWFKQQNKEQNALLGKDRLFDELKLYKLKSVDYHRIAEHFNMGDEETLFAGVETGVIRFNQLVNYIVEQYGIKSTDDNEEPVRTYAVYKVEDKRQKSDLTIYGVDNLLSNMAGCCKPVLGDDIVGYLTQGRGVTVHRRGCPNFLKLLLSHGERVIEVQWGKKDTEKYVVDLLIGCSDCDRASNEINSILNIEKIMIVSLNLPKREKRNVIRLSIAIENMQLLSQLIKKFESAQHIISASRAFG